MIIFLIRVTCCDDYFVEELLYAPLDQLENTKELELKIVTLNSSWTSSINTKDDNKTITDSEEIIALKRQRLLDEEVELFKDLDFTLDKMNPSLIKCVEPLVSLVSSLLIDNQPYILDVDMDFFSTKNPFKELFTEVMNATELHVIKFVIYIYSMLSLADDCLYK